MRSAGRWPRPATGGRVLDLAHDLEVKLPGTKAALRTGVLRQAKADIIARATSSWTRTKPGRPRTWCWAGPGG